jgi:hypothetical protein
MLADKTKLKIGLRKFLAQDPTRTTTLTWDEEKSVIDINRNGRGMTLAFRSDAMNSEGDPLTEENKQDIVDTLQAIVDEHNNNITE